MQFSTAFIVSVLSLAASTTALRGNYLESRDVYARDLYNDDLDLYTRDAYYKEDLDLYARDYDELDLYSREVDEFDLYARDAELEDLIDRALYARTKDGKKKPDLRITPGAMQRANQQPAQQIPFTFNGPAEPRAHGGSYFSADDVRRQQEKNRASGRG